MPPYGPEVGARIRNQGNQTTRRSALICNGCITCILWIQFERDDVRMSQSIATHATASESGNNKGDESTNIPTYQKGGTREQSGYTYADFRSVLMNDRPHGTRGGPPLSYQPTAPELNRSLQHLGMKLSPRNAEHVQGYSSDSMRRYQRVSRNP